MKWIGQKEPLAEARAMITLGHHLLLEGPVGSGKTTLVKEACRLLGRKVCRVDGDGRYTEQKLAGWFDPPLLIQKGYGKDSFIAGPLLRAMEEGAVLFINELNRMPEGVQNVLLTAMDEQEIELPHLGRRKAKAGFVVVGTQNPRDYVATSPLSEALLDRMSFLQINYPPRQEEQEILKNAARNLDSSHFKTVLRWVRGSRFHPGLKRGASIRAGLTCAELMAAHPDWDLERVGELALFNRVELQDPENFSGEDTPSDRERFRKILHELQKTDFEELHRKKKS